MKSHSLWNAQSCPIRRIAHCATPSVVLHAGMSCKFVIRVAALATISAFPAACRTTTPADNVLLLGDRPDETITPDCSRECPNTDNIGLFFEPTIDGCVAQIQDDYADQPTIDSKILDTKIAEVARCPRLRGLVLQNSNGPQDLTPVPNIVFLKGGGTYHHLDHLTRLRYLELKGTPCEELQTLHRLSALQSLSLSDVQCYDLSSISKISTLTRLDITYSRIDTVPALPSSLSELNLGRNEITNAWASTPSLRILRVDHRPYSSSGSLAPTVSHIEPRPLELSYYASLTLLEELSLRGASTYLHKEILSGYTRLRRFSTDDLSLLRHLRHLEGLETIDIRDAKLHPGEGCRDFAEVFPFFTRLRRLAISEQNISCVLPFLRRLRRLHTLAISPKSAGSSDDFPYPTLEQIRKEYPGLTVIKLRNSQEDRPGEPFPILNRANSAFRWR